MSQLVRNLPSTSFLSPQDLLNARLSQVERLTYLVNDVLDKESLTELYDLILEQTIGYFGFDYGAISRIDYKANQVKTVTGKSAKPKLVDPNQWKAESVYNLTDTDILVDVAKTRRSEVICGPIVEKNWDPRLNKKIYDKYNHKELVRIYVPFIVRKTFNPRTPLRTTQEKTDESVLGIIEAGYHVLTCFEISDERRALFELFIKYCAGAVQKLILIEERVALDRILDRLNAQENLLSSAEEIYGTLREVVEEYLKIDAVSVWEKSTASDPFKLKRVAASKVLQTGYDKENIQELPHDSYTADAIKSGKATEVSLDQIKSPKFAYRQIALENNFESMVIIPISIGPEVYAVVDAFFGPGRRLSQQEEEFLERLAARAALAMIAVQNAKLVNSFSNISAALLDEGLETILQSITDSALEVLHANPVILFRYENDHKKFIPGLISSGDFLEPAVRDIPTEVKENDWPNILLNLSDSAIYLESECEYVNFQKQVGRHWLGDRFDRDFWHREQIKSLALLRLEHGNEPVGVLFVNYRTPQRFNAPTKRLIQAFAAQAASAIINAKLLEQDREFWERQRRDSFSLSVSEVFASLAHNSGNLMHAIGMRFAELQDFVTTHSNKTLEKEKIQALIEHLKKPLEELSADFSGLEEYRKFDDFNEEQCQVEDLIESSIRLLQTKFNRKKINIKKHFQHTPEIFCDKHQVQHMLLNLFLNALDAMGRKGTLSLGTEVKDGYVRIRVSDTGTGISSENYSEIFKPFFTTKKHGSGLGLPISRYIAARHGGSLEFSSKIGRETTFSIFLPIERQGE
ncbi:MAG TPA: GAF domain-containing sensor histidine kinase [Pyrinomonadaceae bacterium]|nr:GAF domain-containing sensor histidine kinase [Pyrinomonadaceae bacterium]